MRPGLLLELHGQRHTLVLVTVVTVIGQGSVRTVGNNTVGAERVPTCRRTAILRAFGGDGDVIGSQIAYTSRHAPGLGPEDLCGAFDRALVRVTRTLLGRSTSGIEDGNCDRDKDTDNKNDDHELDEGEALIPSVEHSHVPHLLLPSLGICRPRIETFCPYEYRQHTTAALGIALQPTPKRHSISVMIWNIGR